MYDERQLFTENANDRYAIGDRDATTIPLGAWPQVTRLLGIAPLDV